MIPSSAIVSSLARKGPVHHCDSCGERMFVRSKSGLCPLCWNGRSPVPVVEETHAVPDELCLAGVLDEAELEHAPLEVDPDADGTESIDLI